MPYMPPEQFIQFLAKHCRERVNDLQYWEGKDFAKFPAGKSEAYRDIMGFIELYFKNRKDAA